MEAAMERAEGMRPVAAALPEPAELSSRTTTRDSATTSSAPADGMTKRSASIEPSTGRINSESPDYKVPLEPVTLAEYPLMLRASGLLRRLHEHRQIIRVRGIVALHLGDAERQIDTCRTCAGIDHCTTSARGTYDRYEPAVSYGRPKDGSDPEYEKIVGGEHILRTVGVPCRFSRIAREVRQMDAADLSPRYRDAKWSDIRSNGNVLGEAGKAQAWLESGNWKDGLGLYIEGPIGTGKSMIAGILCREIMRTERDVWRVNAGDLIEARKESWDGAPGSARENVRKRAHECAVLCLEEFGQNPASPWEAGFWADLFDARVRGRKATIVTTNIHVHEDAKRTHEDSIARHYGDAGKRIASRIDEDYQVLRIDAPDFRPKMAKGHNGKPQRRGNQ